MNNQLYFVSKPCIHIHGLRRRFGGWFYVVNIISLFCLITLLGSHNWTHQNKIFNAECNCYEDVGYVPSARYGGKPGKGHGLSFDEMKLFASMNDRGRQIRREESSKVFVGHKIIIHTMFRSGSSFLGDIFAHQPEAYYMFEPLQMYPPAISNDTAEKQRKTDRIAEKGAHFLGQLLNCDLVPFIKDVMEFHKDGYHRISTWGKRIFCRNYQDGFSISHGCNPHRLDKLPRTCQDHQTIVIKTIVLHNLSAIIPLLKEGVKIIHLVRDPRGQIQSIRGVPGGKKRSPSEWAKDFCGTLRRDLEASKRIQGMQKSFRENYRLLRYEDLARDPMRIAKQLYKFAGLTMSRTVKEWLRMATTTRKQSVWSTTRMSNETVFAWRSSIKLDVANSVQEQCGDSMDLLGYVKVNTADELRDLQTPIILPLSKGLPAQWGKHTQ